MRTAEISSEESASRWQRCRRDLSLLRKLIRMILYYWTKGARLRKAYRQCEANGNVFWVDEDPAESERRLR